MEAPLNPDLSPSSRWRLDRQVTTGVILAAVLQTGGLLIWAGKEAARVDVIERRLESQSTITERLARLEEQVTAARAALERVEHKLDRSEAR
jgi:hypothetical protein